MKTYFLSFSLFCGFILNGCIKEQLTTAAKLNTGTAEKVSVSSLTVSDLLSNNMVIQRDKPFKVWGEAPTGDSITVTPSWKNKNFSTVSNSSGKWEVAIPASGANITPQTLVIKDNNSTSITISDILIGEVWVCSGQSNMDMPVDSTGPWFGYEGVTNFQEEIAAANYPGLRLIEIQTDYSRNPLDSLGRHARWTVCSPNSVKSYSAVAYFFGKKVMTDLNVPVGLVVSSVGGTACEAWTSEATLKANPILNAYYSGRNRSSGLYNGMIYPLRNLSIKGFIWYQGESNRHDTPVINYTRLNSAMIKNWRETFNQGELPFYFVQMTPYDENFFSGSKPTDNDYAFFREVQSYVREKVKHTGMAVTMDVGDKTRIHPKNKKPVGERLALLALNKTYKQNVQSEGPQYLSFTQNKYIAIVSFVPTTAAALNTINNEPLNQFFFVAGSDHVFRKAFATISGNKMIVKAPSDTPLPIVSIRYAFTNYPITNLQNGAGLPMEPFRTDNW